MRYLVLSDLHGNWEALQAVLLDAEGLYDRIVCCGDLVGYGPDPNLVVEWAREHLQAIVRGNHDRGCAGIDDLEWFTPVARRAAEWTLGQLTKPNRHYLAELPRGPIEVDGFQLVHGSPFDEDEYLLSADDALYVLRRMEVNLIFFGHSHQQRIYSWIGGRCGAVPGPDAWRPGVGMRVDPDAAFLVNPGSVGQPRDNDPRAAWALYDTETREVSLRRSAYDSAATARKIVAAGLPDILATRLSTGR